MDLPVTSGANEPLLQPEDGGERQRIDYITRLLVVRLRELHPDLPVASVAEMARISESSARRLLAVNTADVKTLARQMMQTAVAERLEDWERASQVAASKGFHQPSRDWLEAAGAIDGKPPATVQVDARPTVMISMPFQLGAIQGHATERREADAIRAVTVPALPTEGTE